MAVTLPSGYVNYVPKIRYYLDSVDIFTQYGVVISNSRGIISAPAVKQAFSQSWDDRHGEAVDLSTLYYEPKEFILDCWVLGTSNVDIAEKINLFYAALRKPGLRRLVIFIDENRPLVYQVYLKGEIDVTKTWTVEKMLCCDFSISFKEPEPLKIVLKGIVDDSNSFSVRIDCDKPVNLRWGKTLGGTQIKSGQNDDTFDITGEHHTFSNVFILDAGFVYPVITGAVESIGDLRLTGLTILWDKLL